jgi:hypothetical protein
MQITYLDAASFAPSFYPDGRRIMFSSNTGDPRGREFDLWAVDTSGANLERVTASPGFDGFPMFSPDGRMLAFASNRATPRGGHDTNVFVARWEDLTVRPAQELAADRILTDVRWLADPAREGRGIGSAGLEAAGTYIEARLQRLGLAAGGQSGSFRETFSVPTAVAGTGAARVAGPRRIRHRRPRDRGERLRPPRRARQGGGGAPLRPRRPGLRRP